MNLVFNNVLKLTYRRNIKDRIVFRHKLLLNIFMAINVLLVSVIIDQRSLTELTGVKNPWTYILAAYILGSILSAIFHMPRALAQSDIQEGRFEYIMTTNAYRRNYFWYYAVALFLIELINLVPVFAGFIILQFVSGTSVTASISAVKLLSGIVIILLAFTVTLLISITNMYASIISRKYRLNSSLVVIIIATFSGTQFPYHVFSLSVRILALINPMVVTIELWRSVTLPGYTSFLPLSSFILAVIAHIVIMTMFSRRMLYRMNRKIRIDGVGRLLE